MATEKRIPRVRIHEDNFADEIKNPPYPEECISGYGGPMDFFIEVINVKDETIALFFHYNSLWRKDFRDVLEYAEYYDSLGIEQWEEEEVMEVLGVTTQEEYYNIVNKEDYEWDGDKTDYSRFGTAGRGVIPYGRLKYPLGLNDKDRKYYEYEVAYRFIGDYNLSVYMEGHEDYSDDLIDFINLALVLANNIITKNKDLDLLQYFQWNPESYPRAFINL